MGSRTYLTFIPDLDKTWKRHINQILEYSSSDVKNNKSLDSENSTDDVDGNCDINIGDFFENFENKPQTPRKSARTRKAPDRFQSTS